MNFPSPRYIATCVTRPVCALPKNSKSPLRQSRHASGRVKVNSIDPQAEDFVGYPCLSISRIVGRIGTPGIARVAGHPWYFNR